MSTAVAAEISKALPGAFHNPVAEKTVAQGIRQIRQPTIANLVESDNPEQWNAALQLLERVPDGDPVDYLPLAFRYWKAANVEQAIRVCDIGMHKTPTEERRIKYKNSLAFYLAERADIKDAERARNLAMEACQEHNPARPRALNTRGFVEITFAETEEQLKLGIALCAESLQNGNSMEAYLKAMGRVAVRQKQLSLRTTDLRPGDSSLGGNPI
jgi:hypothetical protein